MTYQLYIGDRTFSSWSMRGWLMLEKFDLPYNTNFVGLYSGTLRADLAHLTPARTVPAMQTAGGHVVTDSLAMAETLHEAHPEAGLYPADPAARALARSMVCEMHAAYGALRDDCTNVIDQLWDGFQPSAAVMADVARIEDLWALARARHSAGGPWLFGEYSLADVFYAPVACRFTAYQLPISDASQAYVDAHLADPAFLAWRAEAMKEVHEPYPYDLGLGRKPWPEVKR